MMLNWPAVNLEETASAAIYTEAAAELKQVDKA